MKLAVVLGSSAAALEEFAAARSFLEEHGLDLHAICVNDAIKVCPVEPVAFCTVISGSEAEPRFLKGIDITGVLLFGRRPSSEEFRTVKPKWNGTSGLYAVQIALDELGFTGVILAGCPIDAGAGSLSPHSLMHEPDRVERYKPEWLAAMATMGHRVRSMSGWTRELLGEPTAVWLASFASL